MNYEEHYRVARSHPSLAGHFPGNPVVPAVVILDHVRRTLFHWRPDARVAAFPATKFLAPLLPEIDFRVRLTIESSTRVTFQCMTDEQIFAQGSLTLGAAAEEE